MKTKRRNLIVGFFILGGAIKFRRTAVKRHDGTSEYRKIIKTLCRNKSISQLVILSKSDWGKVSDSEKKLIDPDNKIRYIYDEVLPSEIKPNKGEDENSTTNYKKLSDYVLKNIKIDFGIGFTSVGYMCVASIPNFLPQLRDPSKKGRILQMTYSYCTPILHYLNESMLPWFLISPDPRYMTAVYKRRDTYNLPIEIISQYTQDIHWQHIKEYKSDSEEEVKIVKAKYTGIEKMNLIDEHIYSPDLYKTKKGVMVAMQSTPKGSKRDYRFQELKKYILDTKLGWDIYGRWDDSYTEGYDEFKGLISPNDLDELLKEVKYTFVIPIGTNWATSKYAELLRLSIIPFFHKDYDTQANILSEDSWLRIKNPQDLKDKIQYLEDNPQQRFRLLVNLQERLLKDVHSGEFIYEIINKSLAYNYLPYKLEEKLDNFKGYTVDMIERIDKGLFKYTKDPERFDFLMNQFRWFEDVKQTVPNNIPKDVEPRLGTVKQGYVMEYIEQNRKPITSDVSKLFEIINKISYTKKNRNKFETYINYIKKIIKKYDMPFDFSDVIKTLEDNQDYANKHTSFCHGDLTFDNIIFRDDRIILIDSNYKEHMWQSSLLDIAKLLQESDRFELREDIIKQYSRKYERHNGELKFIKSLEITHFIRMWPYIKHKEAILFERKKKINQLLKEIEYNPIITLF